MTNTKIHITCVSFPLFQLLSLMSMPNEGNCPTLFEQKIRLHQTATHSFLSVSLPLSSAVCQDGRAVRYAPNYASSDPRFHISHGDELYLTF